MSGSSYNARSFQRLCGKQQLTISSSFITRASAAATANGVAACRHAEFTMGVQKHSGTV